MTSVQSAGIDLPMKALAWRDEDDQVWLAYNDPDYVAERHGIDDRDASLHQGAANPRTRSQIRHKGELNIVDNGGRGTRFRIRLQLADG